MAKEWWEYIAEPMLGSVGMGFVNPIMGLLGLGPTQPQMPRPEEPNRLAAMLAAQEDRRRREREALLSQPAQGIYPVSTDVAGALRRIRQRPPGGGSRGIV